MSGFSRNLLPDPVDYYVDTAGLVLIGPPRAKWKTTRCQFHDSSDSMRINTATGAFVCMAACGAKGGDVLAYHQAAHGMGFVEAAKALGAYVEDDKPHQGSTRPATPPARALLGLVAHELTVASVVAADLSKGRRVSAEDKDRLVIAAGRIGYVARVANAQ